ncbi:MAG: translation elongation factor Ts [Alphaproteobacteria bacterium]
MTISASLVKELRDKTGAGMMDCKKALAETNGDVEAAVDWLRTKGLAAAAKKAGRVAADGLVATHVDGKSGAVVELNSETDFVAKNDKFQNLATSLVRDYLAFNNNDIEAFKASKSSLSGKTVTEEVSEHIAVIGENMTLRRANKLQVSNGAVVSYVHNSVAPALGKIGVLVAIESDIASDKLQVLGKQIAMHIAASKPESLTTAELDQSLVEREKAVFVEQARASGKPDNVIEKMVGGRIAKFYEQVVLLEQMFVMDGKTKISQVVEDFAKENGGSAQIVAFERFALGEGVEKQETGSFADEVASMVAGR